MNIASVLLASSVDFGLTVSIVGFCIVFSALTLLVIVFTQMPKLILMKIKKRQKKNKNPEKSSTNDDYFIEGNVAAAISLALHMHFNDLHDEESHIVTIKKVKKTYSPWSSKIYSVQNNWPR